MARRSTILLVSLLLAGCQATGAPGGSIAPSTTGGTSAAPASQAASPAVGTPTPAASVDVVAGMERILAVDFNGSALLARDGEVLYEGGVGMADEAKGVPNTAATRFRIASITKQFTAMAILMLEERGLLSRDDPACSFLDSCPEGWERITIEHLLDHTSGIAEFSQQPDFDGTKAMTPAETVTSVADVPLQGVRGETFSYTNTGYVLLGMIIEKVSGQSYEAFLGEHIFEPLAMKDTGYEHGDTPGLAAGYLYGSAPAKPFDPSVPFAAGGLYSTVGDLHRWDEALYTDTLAPASAIERFFTPLVTGIDGSTTGYAYGVVVGEEDGAPLIFHPGSIDGFATYLARYPDDHINVVLLSNRESASNLSTLAWGAARLARKAP